MPSHQRHYAAGLVVGVPSLLADITSQAPAWLTALGLVTSVALTLPMILKGLVGVFRGIVMAHHSGTDWVRSIRGQDPLYSDERAWMLGEVQGLVKPPESTP